MKGVFSRNRFVFVSILWMLFSFAPALTAQEAPAYTLPDTAGLEEIIRLRPLEELVEDALRNSPLLKSQRIDIDNLGEQLKLERRRWANFIGLDASYQYGNGAWIDDIEAGAGSTFFRTNRQNTFYRVGVGVRLPLGEFITRRPRTQILENQMEQEKYRRQEIEINISERVIQEYQNFQLNVRLIDVKAEELEFHRLAVKLAEQYFREGAITVEEFSSTVRERSRAEAELENAKAQARLSYLILRQIVGVAIRRE